MSAVPTLKQRLKDMPKVEIHVHLEGATDAETVFRMAQRNKIQLPASTLEEWTRFYAFRDFNHFIDVYIAASRAMRMPEDYSFMVEQFLKGQAEQNIRYSEAFFTPSLHLKKVPADELLTALALGAS